jgi:hypothetical protein
MLERRRFGWFRNWGGDCWRRSCTGALRIGGRLDFVLSGEGLGWIGGPWGLFGYLAHERLRFSRSRSGE